MASKRKSLACSICPFTTNNGISIANHKRKCKSHIEIQNNDVDECVHDANNHIMHNTTTLSTNETETTNAAEETMYYEMTLTDYEEQILNDCIGIMDFDENDVLDYNHEIDMNEAVIDVVVQNNNDVLNEHTLQSLHDPYMEKTNLQ